MNPHLRIPEVDTLTYLIPVFSNPRHVWRTGKRDDPSRVHRLLSLTVWVHKSYSSLFFFLYPLLSRSPSPHDYRPPFLSYEAGRAEHWLASTVAGQTPSD